MIPFMLLMMTMGATSSERTVELADGVEMAYLDEGQGEPALVFVHCGNCRKEVWTETLAAFRAKHRVVAMDMPGHGRSGAQRGKWSIPLLGADVAALVDHLKLGPVILVGNSIGGPVSLEAARRLGKDRVLGVVAVDTLQNVEATWPDKSFRQLHDAYRADFQKGCNGLMLGPLLPKGAPAAVRERVDAETCGNDPKAAIALLESFREYDQAAAMRDAGVPIWAINATLVPTALETNRKYAPSYDLVLMEGVGHYPQMERPAEFQQNLRRAVRALVGKRADDSYVLGSDSLPQPGVPKGRVEGPFVIKSKVFSDTVRQYWIYVPAAYDASRPHAVMVFQDGHAYVNPEGNYRGPVVFDNLIHKGDMPPTIGIFVNPGHQGDELPKDPWRSTNRSLEYDSLGERYATFLLDELLPEVAAKYNLTRDPDGRAIAGASSGGICSFTVAWERPDAFRKVMSQIGSFTTIRGGHVYPALIRASAVRPLRVFLQDGANDLDNPFGNWWLANQEMAAALEFRGYDHRFDEGLGGHNGKHGGSILPDSLRWLWRGYTVH